MTNLTDFYVDARRAVRTGWLDVTDAPPFAEIKKMMKPAASRRVHLLVHRCIQAFIHTNIDTYEVHIYRRSPFEHNITYQQQRGFATITPRNGGVCATTNHR